MNDDDMSVTRPALVSSVRYTVASSVVHCSSVL